MILCNWFDICIAIFSCCFELRESCSPLPLLLINLLTGNTYDFIILYSEFMICFVSNHMLWPRREKQQNKKPDGKAPSWSPMLCQCSRLIVISGFHYTNESKLNNVRGSVHRQTWNQFSLFCFNWHFISMLIDSANWIIFYFFFSFICCSFVVVAVVSFGMFVVLFIFLLFKVGVRRSVRALISGKMMCEHTHTREKSTFARRALCHGIQRTSYSHIIFSPPYFFFFLLFSFSNFNMKRWTHTENTISQRLHRKIALGGLSTLINTLYHLDNRSWLWLKDCSRQ